MGGNGLKLPNFAVIKEVGPRDGLQNEKKIIGTKDKVTWIQLLTEAGLSYIEVSSFVHPKWVPALADASDVFRELKRESNVTYVRACSKSKWFGTSSFARC